MHIRKMRHEKCHGNEDSEGGAGGELAQCGGRAHTGGAGRARALVVADAVDKFFLKVK